MSSDAGIRSDVREIQNKLRQCQDHQMFIESLKSLCSYLTLQGSKSKSASAKCGELSELSVSTKLFLKNHYVQVANFLLDITSLDNVGTLSRSEFSEYFLKFFIEGCCEDAFFVLTSNAWRLRLVFRAHISPDTYMWSFFDFGPLLSDRFAFCHVDFSWHKPRKIR